MHIIQGQLAICDRPYCDFVCWTTCGMHLEIITRDPMVWDKIQPKLDLFYVNVTLPQILCPNAISIVDETSCSSTQQSSEQVEQLYCICRNAEEGLMIGCDNDCPYVMVSSIKLIKAYQVIQAKCRKKIAMNGHLYSESYQTVNLLLLYCKIR